MTNATMRAVSKDLPLETLKILSKRKVKRTIEVEYSESV